MPGMGLGLYLGFQQQQGGGSVSAPLLSPLTTIPQSGSIIYDFNPDIEIGTATPGAEILSVRDSGPNGFTATSTAGSGPTFQTNVANGHASVRTTAGQTLKWLSLGRPAALAAAMSASHDWSVLIVYKSASGSANSANTIFGDVLNKSGGRGVALGASVTGPKDGLGAPYRTYPAADPASNIHTLIYSGDAGFDSAGTIGRMFMDGTMFYGTYPLSIFQNSDAIRIGNCVDSTGGGVIGRGFIGDILRIIVWSTGISAPEAWQADAYARTTYGKALGTAGMTFFPVFDGDSQTMGTGVIGDNAMPAVAAASLGLISGQYGNVGKPSCKVAAVAAGGSANNMTDSAARDVDQWKAIVGGPIVLICGEWYNQGASIGTGAAGAAVATNNRIYAAARKAADPTIKIIMWTSLASFDRDGVGRDGFNNSLVSTPGSIDVVVPVHTDTNIGVNGAAGTVHTATTYTVDAIHLNATGTPIHASWLTPYIHL